ncbi:MAG TPA: hypothetical protein VM510_15450 [Caulifigura sp.]|nr:hypothetical protein [Caulifigura sp.]
MSEHRETEVELINRAQSALSNCSWTVGECAAQWTKRYAKGRTDSDFGTLIGLSGDQVYQRRRVAETFSDVKDEYKHLKWSHFYTALTWDDAAECLRWADDMQATIAEMKAWRRAQHGEDLSESAAEESPPFDPLVEFMSAESRPVRDYEDGDGHGGDGERGGRPASEREPVVAAVARQSGEEEYAPFGKHARGPAAEAGKSSAAPSAEQSIKRITAALEKCNSTLTPAVLEEFGDLPVSLQQRFLKAVKDLASKADGLE